MRGSVDAALLALIQSEFAFMDGRIDPPSSMHRLTAADLAAAKGSAATKGVARLADLIKRWALLLTSIRCFLLFVSWLLCRWFSRLTFRLFVGIIGHFVILASMLRAQLACLQILEFRFPLTQKVIHLLGS